MSSDLKVSMNIRRTRVFTTNHGEGILSSITILATKNLLPREEKESSHLPKKPTREKCERLKYGSKVSLNIK
jgi:hypothetical protein